jgi:hypothetical protein
MVDVILVPSFSLSPLTATKNEGHHGAINTYQVKLPPLDVDAINADESAAPPCTLFTNPELAFRYQSLTRKSFTYLA